MKKLGEKFAVDTTPPAFESHIRGDEHCMGCDDTPIPCDQKGCNGLIHIEEGWPDDGVGGTHPYTYHLCDKCGYNGGPNDE